MLLSSFPLMAWLVGYQDSQFFIEQSSESQVALREDVLVFFFFLSIIYLKASVNRLSLILEYQKAADRI